MTRLRAPARGITSVAALVVLVAGIPAALLRLGRWPTAATSSGGWWERIGDTVVSDRAIVVVLTLAVTVIWVLFVLSVAVELIAALRGRPARRVLLAGPLQRGARGLVVAALLAFSAPAVLAGPVRAAIATSPPLEAAATTLAAGTHEPAAAVPDPPPITTPTTSATATSTSGAGGSQGSAPATATPPTAPAHIAPQPVVEQTVVTVMPGDSAWELAAVHLGDGMRWRELWDLNQGVPQPDGRAWTNPQLLLPGWQLRLPPTTSPASPPVRSSDESVVHVVEPGDTLSAIAAQYLGDANRYPEVFTANQGRPQPDGSRLTDANLIETGWQLLIPVAAPTPSPPTDTPPAVPATPTAPNLPSPGDGDSAGAPPTTTPDPSPATTSTPPSTRSSPSGPSPAPGSSTPSVRPTTADDRPDGSVPSAALVGIAGAVVLASGFAVRMLRLRRRRGIRGGPAMRVSSTKAEDAVVAAADVPLVRWAGQCIAQMVRDLDGRQLTGAPVAVELSETTGIEVLWDRAQHASAPSDWIVADGGWAWRHRYDPDAPVPVAALPASIPALVTIGQRDGRQLLIDLEAFGVLTVTGPPERVDGFLRAVAVELASGDELSDAYVHVVDVPTGLEMAGLERLDHAELEASIRVLDATRRSVRAALDAAGMADTFAARVAASVPIDGTVIVARAFNGQVGRLLEMAPERGGVAIVAGVDVTEHASSLTGTMGRAHVTLDADGTGHLTPLGLTFCASGLSLVATTDMGAALRGLAELDHIDDEDDEFAPADESAGPNVTAVVPGTHNGHSVTSATLNQVPSAAPLPWADAETPARSWIAEPVDALWSSNDHSTPDAERPAGVGARDDVDGMTGVEVRVLGTPEVPACPQLGRRELVLAVFLACRGGAITASAAQDAIWGGKPVEAKTVWNVVASTRRALGTFPDGSPVMPSVDRVRGLLRLDSRVSTDVEVLRQRFDAASAASSVEAITLLQQGLALVEGPPFDGAGFDWAHRDQDVAEACTLIGHVVGTLVDLALDAGDIDTARYAVTRGLRGLPGDETLYRLRMRIEHHAGRHGGIVAAYDELTVYLRDLETEPSALTTALYRELTRTSSTS